MRDISAGRDIVGCTIMEIVGDNPTVEILQQGANELAVAERNSKRIVSHQRRKRATRAVVFGILALVGIVALGVFGYFWLLRNGALTPVDLIHDSSNVAVGALVSTIAAFIFSIVTAGVAYRQKDPTPVESINKERLSTINMRWEELKGLGFSKAEIKRLRKNRTK